MITNEPTISRLQTFCVTCARRGRSLAGRYREFLLDPGTLVSLASLVLLVAAAIQHPGGLLGSGDPRQASGPLYLLAALVGSAYIWWSAFQGIRERDFTADIPVSVATIAAIAIGQYSAAAVVAVLLLVGGMLEEFVAARAGKAFEALARLLPDRVTVRRDGRDTGVPLASVVVGDLLLIRPGERIAVDGEVVRGTTAVNQAAITGESLPVEKEPGAEVFAGTLVEGGALEVHATKVGEETTLGQIQRLVEEVLEQKAPIERLLDRWAKVYTPVALILATPTALVAAIGNAALRPEAKARVARLNELGLRTVLVSGDNWTTAERIAGELGIREVHAEVLPQQKVGIVKRLQAKGRTVAFVGDGVNDGPALATTDVGIAMGLGGTDVAIETAEIALLSDDLAKLPHLLDVSRRALRAIRQNLVFSLGVLGVAVDLAIPGILTPVTGARLHELSSIPVILSSVRLIGVKERRGGA